MSVGLADVSVKALCLPTRPSLALMNVAAWPSGGDLEVVKEGTLGEESCGSAVV